VRAQLGEEAQLSATEIIRRAERCIGLVIRKGQAEGRIKKRGDSRGGDVQVADIAGMTRSALSNEAYPLADDVSDAQFDAAIEQAKAERNLSRANVVRKVKGKEKPDRWAALADLAADGHTSAAAARAGPAGDGVGRRAGRPRSVPVTPDCPRCAAAAEAMRPLTRGGLRS
jgi:hypothetical protein